MSISKQQCSCGSTGSSLESWKYDLAAQLRQAAAGHESLAIQAGSCEQQFLDGLAEDGTKTALVFVDQLMVRAKAYIDCRFGNNTAQAQVEWANIAAIISKCVVANLSKLLVKDYGGFIGGVLTCTANSLLAGSTGGGKSSDVDYNPSTDNRC